MPPPPPPPLPSAPPPPKVNTDGGVKKTGGGGDAGAGRGMLLSSIQSGTKLKKAVTNDRSSPQIGKVNNGPSGGNESSHGVKEAGSCGPPMSGMFAGGMPKLRPAADKGKPGGGGGTAILPPNKRNPPQNNESNQPSNSYPSPINPTSSSGNLAGQRLPTPQTNSKPPPPPSRELSYDQQRVGVASLQNDSVSLPISNKPPQLPSNQNRSGALPTQTNVRGPPPISVNLPPPTPNRSSGPPNSTRMAPPPPPSRDSLNTRNLPPPPPIRLGGNPSQNDSLRRVASSSSIGGIEINVSPSLNNQPPPPPVHRTSVTTAPARQRSATTDDIQPPPPPPPRGSGMRQSMIFPPPPSPLDSNYEARFQFSNDFPDPDQFRNIQKTYPSKAAKNNEKRQNQVSLPNRSAPPPPPPSGRNAPLPPPPPPNRR
ncbi:WAS/WASL-interacting protein family member 1 isoform X2 [Hydra vulgaris]|uniref:WAS/WASL-interacting protein family member 1 isoform X2 n=1 Tax=Hydra vulgaris TaxID=6087 RepID=A0ABM4CXY7_HYDVU